MLNSLTRSNVADALVARRPWLEATGLLLAPVAVFLVYGVEAFYHQNGVDPFIYTGYISNFRDLVDRYGYPYFAVRFGLILPGEMLQDLLGTRVGYFALRWLLTAGAAGALYILFRRLSGRGAAVFSVALFLTSPILYRAVMTVYSDTTGVPYLTAAVALLLLLPASRRTRLLCCVASGALLALTIHSNAFLAAPIFAALAAWAVVQLIYRRPVVADAVAVIVGLALATAAAALYYWIRFGNGDILTPSIDAARGLSQVDAPDRAPTYGWLRFRPYLYLPGMAVVALLALRLGFRRVLRVHEAAAAAMLTAAFAVYVAHEFLWQGFARRDVLLHVVPPRSHGRRPNDGRRRAC